MILDLLGEQNDPFSPRPRPLVRQGFFVHLEHDLDLVNLETARDSLTLGDSHELEFAQLLVSSLTRTRIGANLNRAYAAIHIDCRVRGDTEKEWSRSNL
jgi:hypothetical protein